MERKCSNPQCLNDQIGEQLKTCGGCHEQLYCRKECQIEHWKNGHKVECSAIQNNKDWTKDIDKSLRPIIQNLETHASQNLKDIVEFITGNEKCNSSWHARAASEYLKHKRGALFYQFPNTEEIRRFILFEEEIASLSFRAEYVLEFDPRFHIFNSFKKTVAIYTPQTRFVLFLAVDYAPKMQSHAIASIPGIVALRESNDATTTSPRFSSPNMPSDDESTGRKFRESYASNIMKLLREKGVLSVSDEFQSDLNSYVKDNKPFYTVVKNGTDCIAISCRPTKKL